MRSALILKVRGALASLAVVLLALSLGCGGPAASIANANDSSDAAANAAGALGASTDRITDFNAARAYNHAKNLVAFGPHPAGSAAILKVQEYIKSELRSYGLHVNEDAFDADTTRGTVPMKNLIGELVSPRPEVVLIAGHYDTKPLPGFVGANDGCSSAAAVLEMARVMAKRRPDYNIWFVFFDGEEAFVDWEANNGMDNTYGSRHMAAKIARSNGGAPRSRIKALILVDMIGDKNLDLRRDAESTRWMVDTIWKTARELGYGKHFLDEDAGYSDDHIPFKNAGVPVVDLLDFNYGPDNSYWHTNKDTLDKISGESMKVVGDVVLNALPEICRQLDQRVNAAGKPLSR